jgi:hypothetical protein
MKDLDLSVADDPAGVIDVSAGELKVSGRYTVLDFDNQPVVKRGTLELPLSATVVAQNPAVVVWTDDTQ